ncbi:hypothetical protein ACFQZX_14675 [Mucilaginibacter litoreus]|uniref:Uncharacterized protein n=1 Tax=Mucilaginibacter litoreus TaxID=1048221 RepID=A0ABW3AUY3_9SPHI
MAVIAYYIAQLSIPDDYSITIGDWKPFKITAAYCFSAVTTLILTEKYIPRKVTTRTW